MTRHCHSRRQLLAMRTWERGRVVECGTMINREEMLQQMMRRLQRRIESGYGRRNCVQEKGKIEMSVCSRRLRGTGTSRGAGHGRRRAGTGGCALRSKHSRSMEKEVMHRGPRAKDVDEGAAGQQDRFPGTPAAGTAITGSHLQTRGPQEPTIIATGAGSWTLGPGMADRPLALSMVASGWWHC